MVVIVVLMFCEIVMVDIWVCVGNNFGQKFGNIVLQFWQIMFYIRIEMMKVSGMFLMLMVYRQVNVSRLVSSELIMIGGLWLMWLDRLLIYGMISMVMMLFIIGIYRQMFLVKLMLYVGCMVQVVLKMVVIIGIMFISVMQIMCNMLGVLYLKVLIMGEWG